MSRQKSKILYARQKTFANVKAVGQKAAYIEEVLLLLRMNVLTRIKQVSEFMDRLVDSFRDGFVRCKITIQRLKLKIERAVALRDFTPDTECLITGDICIRYL